MRDISYRAKRKDNGEWVEGYLLKVKTLSPSSAKWVEKTLILIQQDEVYEVIPETVGQYTGLTDKNGKKVFEGDIIKDLGGSLDGIPRVVIWNEVWMEFETYLVKSHWAYGTNNSRLWLMRNREIEVIGNIHDNPEMLEVK